MARRVSVSAEDHKLGMDRLAANMRAGVDVRDRKFRMRKYPRCFVGKDAVRWLVVNEYADDVATAIKIGNALLAKGYFHHVKNEHTFRDAHLFYRFREDQEYSTDEGGAADSEEMEERQRMEAKFASDTSEPAKLQQLAGRMQDSIVVQDRTFRFKTYSRCWLGSEGVTWLLENTVADTREEAVFLGNKLFDAGCFAHVTREHRLEDGQLFYRFAVDDEADTGEGLRRGWVSVQVSEGNSSRVSWSPRFAKLCDNRLLLYKVEEDRRPVQVFALEHTMRCYEVATLETTLLVGDTRNKLLLSTTVNRGRDAANDGMGEEDPLEELVLWITVVNQALAALREDLQGRIGNTLRNLGLDASAFISEQQDASSTEDAAPTPAPSKPPAPSYASIVAGAARTDSSANATPGTNSALTTMTAAAAEDDNDTAQDSDGKPRADSLDDTIAAELAESLDSTEAKALLNSPAAPVAGQANEARGKRQPNKVPLKMLATRLRNGVEVADNRRSGINYRQTFVGKVAVRWLMSNDVARTREAAVALTTSLMRHQFVDHVLLSPVFGNDSQLYRFRSDAPAREQEEQHLAEQQGRLRQVCGEFQDTAQTLEFARRIREHVPVQDRTHHGRVYESCFRGNECVDTIVQSGVVGHDEEAALHLGNLLLEQGLVFHVAREHRLKNEQLFYRFLVDEHDMNEEDPFVQGWIAQYQPAQSVWESWFVKVLPDRVLYFHPVHYTQAPMEAAPVMALPIDASMRCVVCGDSTASGVLAIGNAQSHVFWTICFSSEELTDDGQISTNPTIRDPSRVKERTDSWHEVLQSLFQHRADVLYEELGSGFHNTSGLTIELITTDAVGPPPQPPFDTVEPEPVEDAVAKAEAEAKAKAEEEVEARQKAEAEAAAKAIQKREADEAAAAKEKEKENERQREREREREAAEALQREVEEKQRQEKADKAREDAERRRVEKEAQARQSAAAATAAAATAAAVASVAGSADSGAGEPPRAGGDAVADDFRPRSISQNKLVPKTDLESTKRDTAAHNANDSEDEDDEEEDWLTALERCACGATDCKMS